jgi:hypothetical protein
MIEEAKARREQVLEELKYQRQLARDEADRGFRSSEADKQRAFSAGESALTRDAAGFSLETGDDGIQYRVNRNDLSADPVMAGENPFKPARSSSGNAQSSRLMADIYKQEIEMGATPEEAAERAREAAISLYGSPAVAPAPGAPSGASTPAISSEPIAVNSAADVANLADGQPVIYKGENYTWNAKKRGFDPVGGGANSEDAAPTPPRRQAAPTAEQPAREAQRPLTDVIRNSPAGSFLRENATGPLSGSRSDNADAPEERTQYGRETALNSQAVQRNQRDPQRDRLARQRNAVIEEIRRLEGLMRAGRIRQPEFNRAMARFEADLARLDQESAR